MDFLLPKRLFCVSQIGQIIFCSVNAFCFSVEQNLQAATFPGHFQLQTWGAMTGCQICPSPLWSLRQQQKQPGVQTLQRCCKSNSLEGKTTLSPPSPPRVFPGLIVPLALLVCE